MKTVNECRVCRSNRLSLWRSQVGDDSYFTRPENKYDLYSCLACNSITLNPLPDLARLDEIYPEGYSSYLRPKGRSSLLKRILTFPHDVRHGKCDRIPAKTGEGHLLDFGCGAGLQLAEAIKKEWKVYGLDFSSNAIVHARRNAPEATIIRGGFDQLPADIRFDCITAFHVVEHMADPEEWIQNAARLIVPGGLLRIEVPIPCVVLHSIFGRYYNAYDTPRHFSIPSISGMKSILLRSGFTRISTRSILFPTVISESVDRAIQAVTRKRLSPRLRRVGYLLSIFPAAVLSLFGVRCVVSFDATK